MEKSFDFLLSNISVTVGIKQTQAKLQNYIFDKKMDKHGLHDCVNIQTINNCTLLMTSMQIFIDLDWFLKHVITDIKIYQFYAHYNYYF